MDYYATLGIDKNASQEEIKRAYRKLAHQHHPDKKGGDEKKFKEINEAYQVLSDPQKRSQFDQFGSVPPGGARGGFGGAQGFGGFDFGNFDFSEMRGGAQGFGDMGDIFSDFFGGGARQGADRGRDIQVDIELHLEDTVRDNKKTIHLRRGIVCTECHGTGGAAGTKEEVCSECRGTGKIQKTTRSIFGSFTQLSVCDRCRGKGKTFAKKCARCGGDGRVQAEENIEVTIPAGIADGQTISVSGKGEAGAHGAPSGTLYVSVHIAPHREFVRRGNDAISEKHISFSQAALGDRVSVETLYGEERMKVPAGVQSGEVFRIKGKGFPEIGSSGKGNHLVKIIVDVPRSLSRQQRKIIESLREANG